MYAVVTTGGKQYRVEAGGELVVERLTGDPGTAVTFDRVLMVGDGDDVTVGTPTIAGATVSGTVLGEQLGPKLIVFKFKQKVKYRRLNGHRQHLTRVRIDEIHAGGRRRQSAKETNEAKAAAPAETDAKAPGDKPARSRKAAESAAAQKAKATAADATEKKPATRRRKTAKAEGEE